MTDYVQNIPVINASGKPAEIGYSIGEQVADRIAAVIGVYKEIFDLPEAEIFRIAKYFERQVQDFAPDLAEEISAMAEAANVDRYWLHALNARSELMASHAVGECTAIHFNDTPFLGQNWDWFEPLEELMILQRITDQNGQTILTLTEPGIVGKIGLNSAGFGVCLNFLPTENLKPGIPTHILIRRLLSAKNWTDIDIILKNAGSARSANLLIANGDGSSRDLEFDGKAAYKYPGGEFATIHTNHYLATDKPVAEFLFENSDARLTRAEVLISEADELTLELLKEILSDRLDPNHPILSSYRNVPMFSGALGTDCSIVMDLGDLKMHVRRGNNSSAPFECLKI